MITRLPSVPPPLMTPRAFSTALENMSNEKNPTVNAIATIIIVTRYFFFSALENKNRAQRTTDRTIPTVDVDARIATVVIIAHLKSLLFNAKNSSGIIAVTKAAGSEKNEHARSLSIPSIARE